MSDTVPAARARELIGEGLRPLVADMDLVRPDLWARPLSDEIRAVLAIRALKGAQYDVEYGVCCAWVPKSAGADKLARFPRTIKQTTLHLWVDQHTIDAQPRSWVGTRAGERSLRGAAAVLARQVMKRAPEWWSTVDSPEGVLREARHQGQNRFDIHSPRARVVAAFTLARTGDLDAARAELLSAGANTELFPLLERVGSGRDA